jgi:hypothetical protein
MVAFACLHYLYFVNFLAKDKTEESIQELNSQSSEPLLQHHTGSSSKDYNLKPLTCNQRNQREYKFAKCLGMQFAMIQGSLYSLQISKQDLKSIMFSPYSAMNQVSDTWISHHHILQKNSPSPVIHHWTFSIDFIHYTITLRPTHSEKNPYLCDGRGTTPWGKALSIREHVLVKSTYSSEYMCVDAGNFFQEQSRT